MRRPRALAVVAVLATAVACAGCGVEGNPGAGPAAVHVRVTEDFGARTLESVDDGSHDLHGSEASLVARHVPISTRPTGLGATDDSGVTSVDGRAATAGERWFLFVNGVEAAKSSRATKVHRSDHVWLDLHDAQRARSISAVVGSFPEPFQDGFNGQRYPSTIAFAPSMKAATTPIIAQFTRLHIPLSSAALGYGANDVLSINVGTWQQLYGEVVAELLQYGPGASGVYARFTADGRQLDLENDTGAVVRRLGAGAGLVAAIASSQDPVPTWLVIGTDRAGVLAAARAVNASDLADHFAIAVQGGHVYPLPVSGSS